MFLKRLKSFFWRLGGVAVIFALGWITDNIASLEISTVWLGMASLGLGYITGEITKWWAIHQSDFGKTFFGKIKKI